LAGLDEPDDNQQTQVDGVEQATEIVMTELRTMVEQNDNQPVPREGLVWRSTGSIGKATASRAADRLAERGRITDSSDGILPTESIYLTKHVAVYRFW
jgi:predicted lipoprotein